MKIAAVCQDVKLVRTYRHHWDFQWWFRFTPFWETGMVITHMKLGEHPAVEINQPGCYPAKFCSYGRLPSGAVDVRLVQGVLFTGYFAAARKALEEVEPQRTIDGEPVTLVYR